VTHSEALKDVESNNYNTLHKNIKKAVGMLKILQARYLPRGDKWQVVYRKRPNSDRQENNELFGL